MRALGIDVQAAGRELTVAVATPASRPTTRSMVAAQDAQSMPVTLRTVRTVTAVASSGDGGVRAGGGAGDEQQAAAHPSTVAAAAIASGAASEAERHGSA